MATRIRLAAAAWVVMSGLFVGGFGAALAVADPDPVPGGETGGAQVDPAGGLAGAPTSGQATAEPTTSQANSNATATVTAQKPTSQVGDGRNALPSDEVDATTRTSTPSKRSALDVKAPPQTSQTGAGEPTSTVSARLADPTPSSTPAETTTKTTTPEPVPTLEPPTDENPAPMDDDPEEHQGWHWWPWCWPTPPGPDEPPSSGNAGDGGVGGIGSGKPPVGVGIPKPPPLMQLPAANLPRVVLPALPAISVDPVVDAVTGLATAAAELSFMPLTLPVIVPPLGAGPAGVGGGGGPGIAPQPGAPAAPRTSSGAQKNQPPRAQEQNPSAFGAGNGAMPASYRAGYGDYLRSAGLKQMAVVAVPGVTGIFLLTGAGGLLGYRQARAGHAVRAKGTARFMG